MTANAEIAVLFSAPQEKVAVPVVMGLSIISFSMVEEADLHCWISPTGQLEYKSDARSSPLAGEPSLEGRLWIGTLGRHWTPEFREYGGHPIFYAKTLRTFASMHGVAHVWYGVLTDDGGCSDVPPVTDDWITSFFGAAEAA